MASAARKIPVQDLLPHAEPMILLSGYDVPTAAGTVASYVDITEDSPFFERAQNGVPSCVALEYMAQTMALCVGLKRREEGLSPRIGYVLGTRRLDIFAPCFRRGVRYRVEVQCAFEDESFGAFDCRIVDEDGDEVAKGTLTAFQPGEAGLPSEATSD